MNTEAIRQTLENIRAQIDSLFTGRSPPEQDHAAQLLALRTDITTLAVLAEGRLAERQAAENARNEAEWQLGLKQAELAALESRIESKDRLLNSQETTFRIAIAILEERARNAEARAADFEAQCGRRDEDVRNVRDEVSKLERENSSLFYSVREQKELVAAREKTIREHEATINRLKEQVTTITKDKLRAEDSLMKTEQELTGAKSKHEAEIYNLQKSACHGECQIKLLQAEMRHQEEVSQLMEDALKSQVQNHEQKLAVETQHKESLKSLLAQEATKNNELREDNNDLDKKMTQLDVEKARLTEEVEGLKRQLCEAESTIQTLKGEIQSLQGENLRLRLEITELRVKVKTLEEKLDAAQKQIDELKEELQAETQKREELVKDYEKRLGEQAQAHHRALEELRKAHDVELKKLQEQHQTRLNDWMQQIYEARQERDAARDRATQLANECNDLRVELSAKQMALDLAMNRLAQLDPQA